MSILLIYSWHRKTPNKTCLISLVFCPHLKSNNVNLLNYRDHSLTVSQTHNASCASLYNLCGVHVSCYIWSLLTFHFLTTEWLQWEMSSNMPVKDWFRDVCKIPDKPKKQYVVFFIGNLLNSLRFVGAENLRGWA